MVRPSWIAVAGGLFLACAISPAGRARAQQPATNQQQQAGAQGDQDQGGPPTLRHQGDPQPSKSANAEPAPSQPSAPAPNAASAATVAPPAASAPALTEQSKIELLRTIDGEFVKVLTPLPGGKSGYHFKAGAPLDQDSLHKALTFGGVALNVGDAGQITKIEFHDRQIQLDINNGAKGKTSWRDRIQVMGGGPISTRTTTTPENAPAVQQKLGATIFLDFDRPVPDMTGEQLKAYLARVLDFSKRSAAVQYADSLPPQMRDAIAAKRAEVGMDHEMVTAAMGRPERKVRERDADGNDTEEWIYGTPPEKTIFVTFVGDKVVRVTQYP
jgi:hypothetical protein